MWRPSRPKILAFKYRLTQVGKKAISEELNQILSFLYVLEKTVLL